MWIVYLSRTYCLLSEYTANMFCCCKAKTKEMKNKIRESNARKRAASIKSDEETVLRAKRSISRAMSITARNQHLEKAPSRLQKMMKIQTAIQFMPAQLSAATYGLEVVGSGKGYVYKPQDFFEFKNILGNGQMGVVFKATFKPENRQYAVKYISNFKVYRNYVVREVEILRMVQGLQFFCKYHSHFRDGNNLYIVMEMYEGGSLGSLITPRITVPPLLGRQYIMEICCALMQLHKIKVAHRDIHPNNVVITRNGHCRLIDFSNCKIMENEKGVLITDCGQAAYRSPEIYLDKLCTVCIDWWSMGILLYRFSTGQTPFDTTKMWQGHQAVTKLKVKYPDWAFQDPKTLNFCQKMLDKNPKTRLGALDENEISGHPYFKPIDWGVEKDIGEIINNDVMSGAGDRYVSIYKKLALLPGVAPSVGTLFSEQNHGKTKRERNLAQRRKTSQVATKHVDPTQSAVSPLGGFKLTRGAVPGDV